jgi:hypothetical protein
MAKKKTNGISRMPIYRSYVFREKDPVIDQLRGLMGNHVTIGQIVKDGGPSDSCMRNWFYGETRRPQNATIEAAGRAMGYERRWQKMRRPLVTNKPREEDE